MFWPMGFLRQTLGTARVHMATADRSALSESQKVFA